MDNGIKSMTNCMKDNFKRISNMEKENKYTRMVIVIKAFSNKGLRLMGFIEKLQLGDK